MTLNTWGKCGPFRERWNFFLEELGELQPDILCLQEVADDELTQMLQQFLGFSHLISSYEAGLLILSRFQILEHQVLTYQHCSPLETNYERKAIVAEFEFEMKKTAIANTHLAWRAEDRPTREGQIGELLEALKKTGFPAIICGDLNDIPESSVLEQTRLAGYESLIHLSDADPITWDNRNPFIQGHSVAEPNQSFSLVTLGLDGDRGLGQDPEALESLVRQAPGLAEATTLGPTAQDQPTRHGHGLPARQDPGLGKNGDHPANFAGGAAACLSVGI